MEQKLPLKDRAYAEVCEAERIKAMIQDLKEAAPIIALSFLQDWHETAYNAIRLCRLARVALPTPELEQLIDRLQKLNPDGDLWEHYVLAEWFH